MASDAPHEPAPSRGRLVFRWVGMRATVPILTIGPQLVAVAALGYAAGVWWIALAPAVVLTTSFFIALDGFRITPRSRAHLYLGLWPFFAWWAGCLVFSALTPIALAAGFWAGGTETWLGGAAAVSGAVGLAAIRRTPRVTRIDLSFPDLPPAFDGYRIAQISDIHCGVFAPEERVRDWVDRMNALRPDLACVTGDLIASGTDYVAPVAAALGELRATDGALACMGNHDYFGAGDGLADALHAGGIQVLRNAQVRVRRGDAELAVAGVDDTWTRRDDLDAALAATSPTEFTLLLAHDPDLFPAAAARGVQLTISGHTHGGQIALPFAPRFNLARLAHAHTAGLYREGSSTLYVNRGAGTSGPPVRIGTRGEIALITLHRRPRSD